MKLPALFAALAILAVAGGYILGINGPTLELAELNPESPTKAPRRTPTPTVLEHRADALCEEVTTAARMGHRGSLQGVVSPDDFADILRDCIQLRD